MVRDWLSLRPGDAAGDCHALRCCAHRRWTEKRQSLDECRGAFNRSEVMGGAPGQISLSLQVHRVCLLHLQAGHGGRCPRFGTKLALPLRGLGALSE